MRPKYFPYFQPIIDLNSGKIAGYEALARTNKNGQIASAGHIFNDPLLNQQQQLIIDRSIRKQALKMIASYPESGFLTINISPGWIDKLDHRDKIPTIEMIQEIGIPPNRIIIEITELAGSITNLKHITTQYQKHGIRVAIDDFGAGYSQLNRVAELEPELIKIDMGLLKEASLGGVKGDILLSLSGLAKRTGSQIICEGIETEHEFHFAIECGADFIQGWIFYPAMETPLDSKSTINKTIALKQSYLSRKRSRTKNTVHQNNLVSNHIEKIRKHIENITDHNYKLTTSDRARMTEEGILRYYLCNEQADQISPNFELFNGNFIVSSPTPSANWSHRPYFSLLYDIENLVDAHIVDSPPYKDRHSGLLCKTFGTFLSNQTILLVDVLIDDNVLFAE